MEFFSVITMVNAWKTQYIISGWLHTPYQTIFIVIYWILKISSLFDHYLWNSPVKRGGQPHGSDQCGYIHLLYRFIFCFTVVGVEHLCRLGWTRIDTSYNKRYYTWTTSTGMNDYYSKVGGSTIDITLMNIIRTTKWMKWLLSLAQTTWVQCRSLRTPPVGQITLPRYPFIVDFHICLC